MFRYSLEAWEIKTALNKIFPDSITIAKKNKIIFAYIWKCAEISKKYMKCYLYCAFLRTENLRLTPYGAFTKNLRYFCTDIKKSKIFEYTASSYAESSTSLFWKLELCVKF